jgi:hypothetical protein
MGFGQAYRNSRAQEKKKKKKKIERKKVDSGTEEPAYSPGFISMSIVTA